MKGVKKVVKVGESGVAVIAETWWQAKTAVDAVPIEWEVGDKDKVSSETIAAWLKEGLDAPEAFVGNANGDARAAIAAAAKKLEAVYYYPYQNHATMEPMNATALYTADKCEVWVPTQNSEAAFAATVAASGLPAEKCDVYKINLGGGFGRRGAFHDYVTQAVLIAKEMPGTPIKLLWTREEDMTVMAGTIRSCRPSSSVRSTRTTISRLHIRLSDSRSSFPCSRSSCSRAGPAHVPGPYAARAEHAFSYTIDNLLIDHSMRNPHILPGFWRGVNINQNCIFIECFMDELAQAVGQDELEFRRKLLGKHPRNLAVLNAAAERIGWGKPAPQGIFRGLAHMKAFNAYVAAAAEISVEGNGSRSGSTHRGGDRPDLRRQSGADRPSGHGSFVYGLSALFYQECGQERGRRQTNFDTYDSMRIADMPKVDRSSCPPAATSRGASVSRRSAWPRPPCSTPTSRRRASASARSR
jgi:isoquinoline 1-oxidoreductase beta subunit